MPALWLPLVLAASATAAPPPNEARADFVAAFGTLPARFDYRLVLRDAAGKTLTDAEHVLLPATGRLYRRDAAAASWSDATAAWRHAGGQWDSLADAAAAPLRAHVAYHFLALAADPAARIERLAPDRLRLQPAGHDVFDVKLDAQGRPAENVFEDGTQVRELDYATVDGVAWPMRFEVGTGGQAARRGEFSGVAASGAAALPPMAMQTGARVLAQAPQDAARLLGPGWLSSARNDYNLSMDAAGSRLVFARSAPGFRQARILTAQRQDEGWSEPREVPFTDARYSDSDPWLTPDGRTLYFVSNRPTQGEAPRRDPDIWRVAVTAEGFGTPEPLPALHDEGTELGPELHDGWLYFNSTRKGAAAPLAIWRARVEGEGFGAPEPLPAPINGGRRQGDFTLSPDGRIALFWSIREDSPDGDIYAVRRAGEGWGTPVKLPSPVNSPQFDFTPAFSPDGSELRFASERQPAWVDDAAHILNGQANLYTVPAVMVEDALR